MAVSVTQIAKALSITQQEALALLRQQGIKISDVNAILSNSDLNTLNIAIQQEKKRNSGEDQLSRVEKARSNLEYYFTNYKVFIDTCSLLHFASGKFWINAVPLIQKTENKIIIPLRAFDEIQKLCMNKDNQKAKKAYEARENINRLIKAQLVDIRGEPTDNFADNVFQVVFTKFRMTHKLLLITQDSDLAFDILNLNNNKSVKANTVYVKRINRFGYLSNFFFNQSKETVGTVPQQFTEEPISDNEKFNLSKTITSVPDEKLVVSSIPYEEVYAQRGMQQGSIKLLKAIASGGEGTIYITNTPYVAKIYKKEKINKRKYEKINLMLSKEIECEGICYPVACIYNNEKQFVGYLMPKAQGKELQRSLFIKPLLIKNFPNWKKRDTVELCVTILEKIKYLHDRNIIMGDINPGNILVVSPKEVYFVDTDSYQIEGFPCPVGTINYTAPEIQRKNFGCFLRTLGNENFAVATLLFMIMLPGKPPYSQQGGESLIENIIKMDFSYPFGEQSNKKTPDGPWRFIWSHLPYDIKEAFYHTFRKDGDNSTEKDRLTVDEWLSKFKYYLQLLDSGKFGTQDKMSEDLFPVRHKKNPKVTYDKCSLCGREVPEETCKNGICKECLNTGDVYKCSRCGKEMIFTNYCKYIKKAKPYDMCPECFEERNTVYTSIICLDCGRRFNITIGEKEAFESKGLILPKRCKDCRKNKQRNFSSISNKPSSYGNSSWCFITTAVCDYFKKPDTCYELQTLRQFRDNWLNAQPDGASLIAEYYYIAPTIVSRLSVSPLKDMIYNELWQEYIKPCIEYIEAGEFTLCKARYISMVDRIKQKYL